MEVLYKQVDKDHPSFLSLGCSTFAIYALLPKFRNSTVRHSFLL